jgi:hypothetical protein
MIDNIIKYNRIICITRSGKNLSTLSYWLQDPSVTRIKEHENERQLNLYVLIQNSIDEDNKENLGDLFLDLGSIEEMTQAFSSRERSLWREAKIRVAPQDLSATFTDFVKDHLDWSIDQVQGLATKPTPLPIDTTRSGSVGGKHSKGNKTRKNAGTVPVQKGNKVKRSAHASDYPARIRGSNQASDPAQKRGLTSKSAQERSQDTLSRKCSQEQDIGEYEHPKG